MADPGPSTSQPKSLTAQQQRQLQQQQLQQQAQEAKQNGRKRRLSMNRKKGNKKGPRKSLEETDEHSNPLLEVLLNSLRTCIAGSEMVALVEALQPSSCSVESRLNMVKSDLRRILAFPDNQASIYEFGSIKSGLLLNDSDLDFYVHFSNEQNEREQQSKLIHIVSGRMERAGTFREIVKILSAKVPLLRAIHQRTNLQCDINFSNARGCYNSKFIYAVMQFDQRIHQLALTIKFWARCAHILTVHKQMNSYCLVMMLIFFLQTRKLPVIPSVEDMQQGINRINYGPWNLGYPIEIKYKTWNKNTVRQLLVSFFQYYSEFDFANNLISPFVGRLCSVAELHKKTIRELTTYYRAVEREEYPEFAEGPFLSIQDPFEHNVNVARVLRTQMLYEQMVLSFRHAYTTCQQYKDKPFAELLEALFTQTERYQKPKVDKASKKAAKKAAGDSPSFAPGTPVWQMCRLPPIEYELFLVKEILMARDPEQKVVITNERIRQLWGECMLDFIVDILRKLYMVKMEPIECSEESTTNASTSTATTTTTTTITVPSNAKEGGCVQRPVQRYLMSCERQVFIARKRVNITNEAELKQEIEISKARWEKNHSLRFRTLVELSTAEDGDIQMRIPSGQPKNGPLRLFIDTCFLVHIRKCIRGYFMVMLAKAKEKAHQLAPKPDTQPAEAGKGSSTGSVDKSLDSCSVISAPLQPPAQTMTPA